MNIFDQFHKDVAKGKDDKESNRSANEEKRKQEFKDYVSRHTFKHIRMTPEEKEIVMGWVKSFEAKGVPYTPEDIEREADLDLTIVLAALARVKGTKLKWLNYQ